MDFEKTLSSNLRHLPIDDYEKRTFNLRRYIKNGHL